jgi:hypothetical protein
MLFPLNVSFLVYSGTHDAIIKVKCRNCRKSVDLHVLGKTLTPFSEVVVAAAFGGGMNIY